MNNNSGKTFEKVDGNKKIKLESSCKLWIALFLFIGIAIFLPTYLGIVGLLFSSLRIATPVFSAEAIFLTLIIILILSIGDIYRNNNLLRKQTIYMIDNQK